MSQTVKMQFAYVDESTRIYSFDCEDSLVAGVKPKIQAVNSSLRGEMADGLESFFVSEGGASMSLISGATIESSEVVAIEIVP